MKLIAVTTFFLLFISVGKSISPMLPIESGEQIMKHFGESGSGLQLQWNTNAPCFVVLVAFSNPIYIDDILYSAMAEVNGTQKTTWANMDGFFLTNGTWLGFIGGMGKSFNLGEFRYFHFDLGSFNYTYDNRNIHNISGRYPMGKIYLGNLTLTQATGTLCLLRPFSTLTTTLFSTN